MTAVFAEGRHVKGVNLIGLVKTLKVYRRQHEVSLTPETAALLDDRILVSSWYPLMQQWELLDFVYRHMLGENPEQALAMGAMGGREVWSTTHRAVIGERAVLEGLRAMAPAWHTYFDFGSLQVESLDAHTVRFTVDGYADVPVCHGMTIAGWHLAAAQVAGASDATAEVIEKPWQGAPRQVHLVRF